MIKDTIFMDAKRAHVTHHTDAPVIAVKFMETGYWPIHTRASPDDLNLPGVTEEIIEATLIGSMFGWDAPGAEPAKRFFEEARGVTMKK